MTTRETLALTEGKLGCYTTALISKLAPTPSSLHRLHTAHLAFCLNTYEQFHARKGFRTVEITHTTLGNQHITTWHSKLPCGRDDGVYANFRKDKNIIFKCYGMLDRMHGKCVGLNSSGQAMLRCTIANNYLDGASVRYADDGSVLSTVVYKASDRWSMVFWP